MKTISKQSVKKARRELVDFASANRSQFQPYTWVNLREQLSPYAFDQAWLLCEYPEGQWAAWVPDLGEVVLVPEQFYSA